MKSSVLKLILCIALAAVCSQLHAQIDDVDVRQRSAITYRGKDFVLTGKYYLLNNNGGTTFRRSLLGLEANYKIAKWLRLGGEYRFATSYTRDFHRFYAYALLDYNIKKWEGNYRAMYQADVTYFDPEAQLSYPVRHQTRHLLGLTWHYSRKIHFFANTEGYFRIDPGQVYLRRMVYAVGGGYLYKGRNQWSGEAALYNTPGSATRAQVMRYSINYTHILGKKKGKKKKKSDATDADDVVPGVQ